MRREVPQVTVDRQEGTGWCRTTPNRYAAGLLDLRQPSAVRAAHEGEGLHLQHGRGRHPGMPFCPLPATTSVSRVAKCGG